ncbi:PREDICTED: uncharacterized protein LOC109152273 [Ipomoea nil]|uniref:uncharacterized protein LOC109152273 n=1 Tax=Ipomoea nil TaxID=35883 RepID=UPI000900E143|nr:PREDICTED: uncharacterized protein LOC109152273 [Ipomoea nil]
MGDILKLAGMSNCKPLATPASISRTESSDELYENPTQYRSLAGALQYLTITQPYLSYAELLKRVLRYFKGTVDFGIWLAASSSTDLHAFSDSDWAGCSVDMKSTSGFVMFRRRLLGLCHCYEIGFPPGATPRLWCDNLGATYLCANPVFHARTKHVEINFHFLQDKVATGELQVSFISTKDQLVDIFTKPLRTLRFEFLRDMLIIVSLPS